MDEWLTMPAAALGRGIEAGRIDPVDLAETFLSAIDAHPLSPRIYARTTPDRARAEARAARERAQAGLRRSPLDGVPISWKDLFDTAGTGTEAGSALLAGRVPECDAAVLRNATHAGLVCLGKTHMSELAFSGLGMNPVMGTPPCVHDAGRVAGGSSGGAASSVAHGLAAVGIGSDTAGSIRVPAVWNDLVGYKPGHGSAPMGGVVPLCPRLDTLGPLARSVEDSALIFAAMTRRPAPDLAGATLKGTRLLLLEGLPTSDLDPEVQRGFDRAVAALEAAGATIERREIPEAAAALDLAMPIFTGEAYGIWKATIEADPDKMFHQIRTRFRGGKDILAADYVAAWQELDRLRAAWRAAVAGYDATILPTSPITPPQIARLESDDDYYASANLMCLRNTRIGSLLDLAGVTLPTGVPSSGLLIQRPAGGEGALLRLASAAEAALR